MKYFEKRKIYFQNLFNIKKYIIVYNNYYYILNDTMNFKDCVKMNFNFLNYILFNIVMPLARYFLEKIIKLYYIKLY